MDPYFDLIDNSGTAVFQARDSAIGGWGAEQVSGPAVVGLLAQVLEDEQFEPGFVPGRTTFELLRAFGMKPTVVRTETVRTGSRIKVSRVEAVQDQKLVAAAVLVQYRASENAPGQRWHDDDPAPFPDDANPNVVAWFHSDAAGGWTQKIEDHLNTHRTTAWWKVKPVTAGRELSPYVRAVVGSEWTSLVTNLGTERVGYINGDLTVALSRLPEGEWIGVRESSHVDTAGVAVGTSTIHDRLGPIGSGMVTCLNNAHAAKWM